MEEAPIADATVVGEEDAQPKASPAPDEVPADHRDGPDYTGPPATALATRQPSGSTELIHAASAAERIEEATAIATALDGVIRAQGMRTKVGSQKAIDPATGEPKKENGRDVWVPRWHVNVEGWQTLATLLGLAVVPLPPQKVIDPETGRPEKVSFEVREKAYHAKNQGGGLKHERTYTVEGYSWSCRVEVFKDGVLIGAGESVCSRTEQRWKEADDYAVMGMAQTRATSRAIGAAAKWIVTLAGYSATPAEEMPAEAHQQGEAEQDDRPPFGPKIANGERRVAMNALRYLVALDVEKGDQAQILEPALADVVSTAATKVVETCGGYMPRVVGLALNVIARAHDQRLTAWLQDQDAETPPPGTGERREDQLPAGSLEPTDENVEAHCICKPGETDDECPINGHGIPF